MDKSNERVDRILNEILGRNKGGAFTYIFSLMVH